MLRLTKFLVFVILICGLSVVHSCKEDATLASLTTSDATSITANSLVTGGEITDDGGAEITSRGVCYGTTENPDITGYHLTSENGTGTFINKITGLEPNTSYHIRAYATNSEGTAYGPEVTATTVMPTLPVLTTVAVSSITPNSATSGGNISSDGNDSVTVRGVCWSINSVPTVSDSKTIDGAGKGNFVSQLSGLLPGTLYHLRAYATNSAGTGYGNEITFSAGTELAVLTTGVMSQITVSTAVSGGNITSDGGSPVTARGVCWSTQPAPTTSNSFTTNGTGKGMFTSNITGLAANTTYHVRAYATNANGTAYGNEITFTTIAASLPALTTEPVTSISLTTAISGGNITSNGGGAITESGVCWATSTGPTINNSKTTNGSHTGVFTANLTGLTQGGTIYYVRAYATNSAGTAYGNERAFSTNVADIEGNSYSTIRIGTQIWMTENLKTATLNNGTAIPLIEDNDAWRLATASAYCWYNNDISFKAIHGAFYNWFAVETGNLCPTGWDVPSDEQFNTLQLTLGMPPDDIGQDKIYWVGTDQGTQLKSATQWNGTNTSGFNALPGGYRYGADGTFNNLGDITYWWTSTVSYRGTDPVTDPGTAWYRRLDTVEERVFRGATNKRGGKYVRCIKN